MRFPPRRSHAALFKRSKTFDDGILLLSIDINLPDEKKDDIDVTVTRISHWKYIRVMI